MLRALSPIFLSCQEAGLLKKLTDGAGSWVMAVTLSASKDFFIYNLRKLMLFMFSFYFLFNFTDGFLFLNRLSSSSSLCSLFWCSFSFFFSLILLFFFLSFFCLRLPVSVEKRGKSALKQKIGPIFLFSLFLFVFTYLLQFFEAKI